MLKTENIALIPYTLFYRPIIMLGLKVKISYQRPVRQFMLCKVWHEIE